MSGAEELLDRRPASRRPAPGWLVLGGVLLALAGLIVVVQLDRHAGTRHPGAVASSMAPAALVPSATIYVAQSAPVAELDHTVFAVAGGDLLAARLDSALVITVPLPVPSADYVLLADAPRHRLWLVQRDSLRIDVYSSSGVAQSSLTIGGEVDGVTLLDGELYVAGPAGVRRIVLAGAALRTRPSGVPPGELIAADPARNRLLFVDHVGALPAVRAQQPRLATPEGTGALPLNTTALIVAGANVWVAGFDGANDTVLERLDPGTLRPIRHSPLEQLLPGVIVVGADAHVLLVRDITGGDGLWCVDARSGAVRQSWPAVPGAVALGPDGAYAITSSDRPPRLLTDSRCPR
jgi:hypothetical protein